MDKSTSRHWDWLSVSLLFLLIQIVSARLVTTNWAAFLYFSEPLAALGTILGLALGVSRFGRRMVIWLTLVYTAIAIPSQVASATTDTLLVDRLAHTGGILIESFSQFIQRKPVNDSLFFVAIVCIIFWFISLAAGYWLVRHNNILVALLPSFIAILIVQLYDNYREVASWWLAVFILVVLLFLGREYYLQNQKNWIKHRLFIIEESWSNIFGGLFSIVAIVVVIAWLIPTSLPSVQSAADTWIKFTKPFTDRLSNAVSSLKGPYGNSVGNYFGSTLGLGQDAGQGDLPVFAVKVLKEPAFSLRYYWRGRVYDNYKGGQWSNSPVSTLRFLPNGNDLIIPNSNNRSEISLRFTIQFPIQSLIYAPSQPVWIDRPGSIVKTQTDTTINDILYWETTSAIRSGGQYQVRAEVADPDVQQLRSAGTEYPQWVKDRYLEVPDNITAEIKNLANKVSGTQSTPYDKTEAITNYLRENIQYVTSLPAPPAGRDPVLWVLFEYKKGFCNYYASAEVLMLRSIGIPARLAVGFAQGQYRYGEYIVLQRDAHAWPEVYFPGTGWVEFEPTVSQDALVRPNESAQANGSPSGLISPQQKLSGELEGQATDNSRSSKTVKSLSFLQTIPGRALIVVSVIISVALAIFLLRRYQVLFNVPIYLSKTLEQGGNSPPIWIETWLQWNQSKPVERMFAVINWSLRLLGNPQTVDATTTERSQLLKKLLPSVAKEIDVLTYEVESSLFTTRVANLRKAQLSSLLIVVHTLRAKLLNFLDAIDGRDVYSR